MDKPTQDEVLKYAKPLIYKFIAKYANDIPYEQKQEIEQTAYLRLLEGYSEIDPERGWKSFVYNHARGTVLDYLKAGTGFEEDKWSLSDEYQERKRKANPHVKHRTNNVPKMKNRVFLSNSDDTETLDIDYVLGQAGIFNELDIDRLNIRWPLIAQMASQDDELLAFAKWLKGFNLDELAQYFGVSRNRVSGMIKSFVERFDDPALNESPWQSQIIYAFGLARRFGIQDCDQSKVFNMDLSGGFQINLEDIHQTPDQLSFFDAV